MAFRYTTPAGQNDLARKPNEEAYLEGWSKLIEDQIDDEITELKSTLGQEPLFFSERDVTVPSGVAATPVPWVGFPRPLMLQFNGDRAKALAEAEVRKTWPLGFRDSARTIPLRRPYRQQDEYLEWVPLKENGEVVGFAFTAEGPEYWEHLAHFDKEKVRTLYEEFTGRDVSWSELSFSHDVWRQGRNSSVLVYRTGDYNPYNAVNMEECAAHLTHPANTLVAEIDLAAKATVQREDASGTVLSERRRLACCSDFGDANRNSDPSIGLAVNLTVRGGVSLTLADPVGLYILAFDENRIADKHGNSLDGWWKLTRGVDGRGLRAVFRPPAGSPLTIADVRVGNGEPLTSGGQLAELTTMAIYAKALRLGIAEPQAKGCVSHCCVQKGSAPESSLLDQVSAGGSCQEGFVDAFPELTEIAITPFSRRSIGAGAFRRGVGEMSGDASESDWG